MRLREAFGRARDDHTDVDELFTLDPGNDAYYSVIIRIVIAHGSPPPGKHAGIEPAQQVLQVSVPVLVALAERRVPNQPGVRNKFNYTVNDVWCDPLDHL